MPYGFSGVMAAAAVVFFAYIGFDAVSTTAEEAKNPQRDLPIGIIASLVICTMLYLVVPRCSRASVPGGRVQGPNAQFLNAPVGYALAVINQDWAAGLVSAGAVAGITSVLLVMLMSQPRIFFAMSRDRLLPAGASKVHPKFKTPYVTTIITGLVVVAVRRTGADPDPGRDDQHRDAVCVHDRLRGRDDAARRSDPRPSGRSGCPAAS